MSSLSNMFDKPTYFGKLTVDRNLCYNVLEASLLPAGRSKMAFAFPLSFLQKGVNMMTDFEMLSIVIMIITLVVSLLINNRDK